MRSRSPIAAVVDDFRLVPLAQDSEALRQRARQAEQEQDWRNAARAWSDLRGLLPNDNTALVGLMNSLSSLNQTEAADAVFEGATARLKKALDCMIAYAVSADRRGDRETSVSRWAKASKAFPESAFANAALASSLAAIGKIKAAEAIIHTALKRFPQDADVLVHAIHVAIARGDWHVAARRLRVLYSQHPDLPYVAVHGAALEALIINSRANAETDRLRQEAEAAERQADWQKARSLWACLHDKTPGRESFLGVGRGAREAGDFADADAILAEAIATYPADAEIFANYAKVASSVQDWDEAARRWRIGLDRFPQLDVCADLIAEALRRIGALEEAEQITTSAIQKYPGRLDIHVLHATVAQDAERWHEAVARWDVIAKRVPDDAVIRDARGRAVWHAGLQDPERQIAVKKTLDIPSAVGGAETASERLKRLVLTFEGLGDNCEFGMVQRHFGAEPLGLLRFSAIYPLRVAELLAEEFVPLGDPLHTRLHEAANGSFMVEDDRGYYRMHTFLTKADVDPEKLLKQQLKRIKFLKRELMDDLRAGDKIYVCKESERRISDDTLHHLSGRLQAYGRNLLVGLRLAEDMHPPGFLEQVSEDILVGYVSEMYTQDPASREKIDFPAWQKILEAAHSYKTTWQSV